VFAFPKSLPRRIALFGVALFFVGAGVFHFVNAAFFVAIVPPYLPAHLELVYLSGVFEILGGLGVLPAATRRLAGWGLLALLAAVYPANVHMALHPELFPDLSPAALVARLPLQFVFAAWVWVATRPEPREDEARAPAGRPTGGPP
jgi:uncharacterized membrane protein